MVLQSSSSNNHVCRAVRLGVGSAGILASVKFRIFLGHKFVLSQIRKFKSKDIQIFLKNAKVCIAKFNNANFLVLFC